MDAARPGLKKLLRDAAERKFDSVVCDQIGRLSRSMGQLLLIFDTLHRHKVSVFTIQETQTIPWPQHSRS